MNAAPFPLVHDANALIADVIAQRANELYACLPRHGKPTVRPNGVPEWTILATISLVITASTDQHNHAGEDGENRGKIIPISLGTGVKVLPASRLPPLGDTLHDCHAEILARRGFVRWLIDEAHRVARGDHHEGVLEWTGAKFGLKEGIQIWLYVSTLPCGDASTLHTAAYQPASMASLKSQHQTKTHIAYKLDDDHDDLPHAVRGRNGYENFGAIRTKPGRADSIPSISMSCSDKIASWSVLGLQGGLLDGLFMPMYLDAIVVGGVEEEPPPGFDVGVHGEWQQSIRSEIKRALWRRVSSLKDCLPEPYHLHQPIIHLTTIPFSHSKLVISRDSPIEPVTSMLCLSCIPRLSPAPEVLFNGSKQTGTWKSPGHILLPEKKRTRICQFEIMSAFLGLVDDLTRIDLPGGPAQIPSNSTYYDLKHLPDSQYQHAKALLRGRPRPAESLQINFGSVGSFEVSGVEAEQPMPPFKGWIVAGKRFQSFTQDGQVLLREKEKS